MVNGSAELHHLIEMKCLRFWLTKFSLFVGEIVVLDGDFRKRIKKKGKK